MPLNTRARASEKKKKTVYLLHLHVILAHFFVHVQLVCAEGPLEKVFAQIPWSVEGCFP